MLGWEYPPFHSGGLGVATKNLSEALAQLGLNVSFALPAFVYRKIKEEVEDNGVSLVHSPDTTIEVTKIPSAIPSPYVSEEGYRVMIKSKSREITTDMIYGENLFLEIERYAQEMERFVADKEFHLIHAHDWLTFPAAARIRQKKSVPLVLHIHATEYDRTGGQPNPRIYEHELNALMTADKVIAVSNYTKNILKQYYGLADTKVEVVHNGVEAHQPWDKKPSLNKRKTVLFLGRLTVQKGPDWFIKIAKRVLSRREDVDFLIAGTGDMMTRLIDQVAEEKLYDHVHFLGFLTGEKREEAFAAADVYILPSVSEPFGLSAVEAARRGIPVVLSKQSGVKEVLYHSLTADFWDVDKMAHNILGILEYPALNQALGTRAGKELVELSWSAQAQKVRQLYQSVLAI